MKASKFNKNFLLLLKIFAKHPHMLLRFLEKNNAFTEKFKRSVSKSIIKNRQSFTDMNQMVEFYAHLLDTKEDAKTDSVLEWNRKLSEAIDKQQYEEAAKIRDTMTKKGYKILI
jgi:excinuclease UvrABC helicase subunit UvrB